MTSTLGRAARASTLCLAGAALGVGGIFHLLSSQAKSARRVVEEHTPKEGPSAGDGRYGDSAGQPIRFVLLGDSSAVGLGVDSTSETPGILISTALSDLAQRPVEFTLWAWIGAESCDLVAQVDLALEESPDLAIIMIGANDVTTRTRPSVSVRYLSDAVTRLRAADCQVVVATCPDLGTIRPVRQPLRSIARRWSRQLAALQTVGVVTAGGRTVSLGAILGPAFASNPGMFSADEFHPSAQGYAAAAAVIFPTAAAALGLRSERGDRDRTFGHQRVTSVEQAAVRAVERAGTEVSQAAGRADSASGWARLRRRRPAAMAAVDDPGIGHREEEPYARSRSAETTSTAPTSPVSEQAGRR